MQAQLEAQIRARVARFYEGWTACDDPTCGHRTRMMGVYGRRCLRPGCQGTVAFEVRPYPFHCHGVACAAADAARQYSDSQMYMQLRYYAYLFDVAKAAKGASPRVVSECRVRFLRCGGADRCM